MNDEDFWADAEWIPAEAPGPWFGLWHTLDKGFIAFNSCGCCWHLDLEEFPHLVVRELAWVAYETLDTEGYRNEDYQ